MVLSEVSGDTFRHNTHSFLQDLSENSFKCSMKFKTSTGMVLTKLQMSVAHPFSSQVKRGRKLGRMIVQFCPRSLSGLLSYMSQVLLGCRYCRTKQMIVQCQLFLLCQQLFQGCISLLAPSSSPIQAYSNNPVLLYATLWKRVA